MPTFRATDSNRSVGRQQRASSISRDHQLSRDVHCALGVPVDIITMSAAVDEMAKAMESRKPLLLATPNLNFLASVQSDPNFRDSLLTCDLCTADGTAFVWICRFLGIPVPERVAGSDLFDNLKNRSPAKRKLTVFMFGGPPGVADAAYRSLNAEARLLRCVGALNPGFVPVEEMSTDEIMKQINSSGADFLMVSLGAIKGQEWLQRNDHRLHVPVRSHLGATMAFQAGTLKRAPVRFRELGLEWLWRIKEEKQLWRRYWGDAKVVVRLLLTRVFPLLLLTALHGRKRDDLHIERVADHLFEKVWLSGSATARHADKIRDCFCEMLRKRKDIVIDLSNVTVLDSRFLGLCMMLKKQVAVDGITLQFIGVSGRVARLFRLNGAEFLLSALEGESSFRYRALGMRRLQSGRPLVRGN